MFKVFYFSEVNVEKIVWEEKEKVCFIFRINVFVVFEGVIVVLFICVF